VATFGRLIKTLADTQTMAARQIPGVV